MMNKRPYMPMFWNDYIGGTGHLTTVQHGAYLLLLAHYWVNGALPNDDQHLANIARMSLEGWKTNKPTLQAFFHDGWKHKRVEAELRRSTEISAKRKISGQMGGTVTSINKYRNH